MKRIISILLFALFLLCSCNSNEERIVSQAAKTFRAEYIQDYIAQAELNKEVFCADSVIQHLYMKGLWGSFDFNQNDRKLCFQNKNKMGKFLPLEVRGSELIAPGSAIPIEPLSIRSVPGYEGLLIGYSDDFDRNILLRKRALEIFGPLNPTKVKYYSYQMLENKGLIEISFTPKQGFPKKIRFLGAGVLSLDNAGRMVAVSVINMEDRYSSYYYIENESPLPRVSEDFFLVEYAYSEEGAWTKRVVQEIAWREVSNKTLNLYYCPEQAPYRNPFKYRISTRQEIDFCEPVTGKVVLQEKTAFPLEDQDGPVLPVFESQDSQTQSLMRKVLADRISVLQEIGLSENEIKKELCRIRQYPVEARRMYERLYSTQHF